MTSTHRGTSSVDPSFVAKKLQSLLYISGLSLITFLCSKVGDHEISMVISYKVYSFLDGHAKNTFLGSV